MQTQNQQLLQQIAERDDYNIKVNFFMSICIGLTSEVGCFIYPVWFSDILFYMRDSIVWEEIFVPYFTLLILQLFLLQKEFGFYNLTR